MSHGNILIIEDDKAIRDTYKLAFEVEDYSVFTASNGREGLESLQKIPRPCLILLDLMMPVMDGWEFTDILEQDASLSSIPVVVVTCFKANDMPAGSKEVIKKPVELDTLYSVAKKYC